MKKRLLSVLLSIIVIMTFIPTALAGADITPPALNGVNGIDKSEYNLGDTLSLTVLATDSESGLDTSKCYASFYGTSGCVLTVRLNTLCDGGLQGSCTLNELEEGTYTLGGVHLADCNEYTNEKDYYGSKLPDIHFTLNSDYQCPPFIDPVVYGPRVTKYSISKKTAYVGDTVKVTVSLKYSKTDSSKIDSLILEMGRICASWFDGEYSDMFLTPVEGKSGVYSGDFKITPDMPDSRYYLPNCIYYMSSGKRIYADVSTVQFDSLRVINPALPYIEPEITSYSMSGHSFVQNEKITIKMAITDGCDKIIKLRVRVFNLDTGDMSNKDFILTRQTDGTFSGTTVIPKTMRTGNYILSWVDGTVKNGDGAGIYIADYLRARYPAEKYDNDLGYFKGSNFTVLPIFTVSGTENKSIPQGSVFDAMEGVTANNYYTGDITDKIAVTGGDFDTNVPGLHLVKYNVSDTVPYPVTYTDYRWVGVTEIAPDPTGADTPLVVNKDDIAVSATDSEVSIKKDGKTIKYSDMFTSPGKYTFTIGSKVSSAVIDQSAPTFKLWWLKNNTTGMIDVSIKPGDVSGTAEIRYMAGTQTAEACISGGTVTDGKFSVPGYGKYTIYTKDGLGNEAVKTININTSAYGTAYLDGVSLSAGKLTKAFSSTKYSYDIKLSQSEKSVTITPAKLFDAEGMTIDGKAIDSKEITVKNGKSRTVKVTVKLGTSKKTYTFKITRAKSTDAALKSLTATAGTFNMDFDPKWNTYTLNLDKDTPKITIVAAANGYNATVSPKSATYTLKAGQAKTVKIKVKAQSGAVNYYTVKIIRANS